MPSFNDVDAAEKAAAEFLFRLEDLVEEYNQITAEMHQLACQLSVPLNMRDGESYGDFMDRHGEDTPQALIAKIACWLGYARQKDLYFTIEWLDRVLAEVVEKLPPPSPAPPKRPRKPPLPPANWQR